MTYQEINIAIAEACGAKWYEPEDGTSGGVYIMLKPFADMVETPRPLHRTGLAITTRIPDYCRDLNAMHEAETWLSGHQWADYFEWLQKHGKATGTRATAKERAEGFLRAKGLWKP